MAFCGLKGELCICCIPFGENPLTPIITHEFLSPVSYLWIRIPLLMCSCLYSSYFSCFLSIFPCQELSPSCVKPWTFYGSSICQILKPEARLLWGSQPILENSTETVNSEERVKHSIPTSQFSPTNAV